MGKKVLVGLLSEEQEFQVMQAADARNTAARLGLEVEVVYAEGHAVLQIQQMFKAIHAPAEERPVAIVVETATGEGLERVARNAVKAGMGWIVVNIRPPYVAELRQERPDLPIAVVGGDQREAGRIQGRQCRALLPRGGRVLCVQGPPDSTVTLERYEGLLEVLEGGGFEVKNVNGAWSEASGEKAVAGWLRIKSNETFHPDVLASQNDLMAVGARRALTAHRRDQAGVPCLGCDGLPEGGQRLVAARQLAATIVTPSNTGPALELVERWLRTGETPPAELLLPPRSHPPVETLTARR